MNESLTPSPALLSGPTDRRPPRVASIDLLRGVIMVLMALDHARAFFTNVTFDPLDLSRTTPALFFTRWVTHFCAPNFVFLAGTAAFLYGHRVRGKAQLATFLITRGLWLVFLEFTLVHLGWFFNFNYPVLIGQVIWAIGWSMVLLAGLALLPAWAVALVGAALVAGHNLFDQVRPVQAAFRQWLVWGQVRPGPLFTWGTPPNARTLSIAYPILPWLGIMALGYGLGALWVSMKHRRAWLAGLGLAAVLLFIALRWANGYGNPRPWAPQDNTLNTVLAFIDCQKYPPSLAFVLMTVGPALLALAAFDGVSGGLAYPLIIIGRVPLYFYLLHVPLIHALAIAVAYFRYPDVGFLFNHPFVNRAPFPPDYGYGLPAVYLATLVAVLCLYPLCWWFEGVKRRSRSVWLSYL